MFFWAGANTLVPNPKPARAIRAAVAALPTKRLKRGFFLRLTSSALALASSGVTVSDVPSSDVTTSDGVGLDSALLLDEDGTS